MKAFEWLEQNEPRGHNLVLARLKFNAKMEEQLQKKIPPLLGKMIGEEIAEK
jgi:flagellar biosynthesis/type III secretory pathway M-ring protein FliF/YscJ